MESYDINVRKDVTVHDPANEALSMVVIVLLIIFFPIGIIVFICRTVSRLRSESIERKITKANIESIKSETSLSYSKELLAYHELYKKGILDEHEFEAKKIQILSKQKIKPKKLIK